MFAANDFADKKMKLYVNDVFALSLRFFNPKVFARVKKLIAL